MRAVYGFMVLGPAARPALPELISMLDDPAPEVRALAAFAIGKIGPAAAEAIPKLQALINNAGQRNSSGKWKTEDKYLAAYALGRIGPPARPALPQIMALKADPNFTVRFMADAAFVRITGEGLAPIVEALKNPVDSTNWISAAQAIHLMGTNGAPAIPYLIEALQQTNKDARSHAVQALGAIHLQPDICIPALLPLISLSNTNNWLRAEALNAIRNFGPTARGIVPVADIMPSLIDPDETVRAHATNILRQIQ